MKQISDILKSAPEGATHVNIQTGVFTSCTYIKQGDGPHQIWLGKKHGGWSFVFDSIHHSISSCKALELAK